MRKNSPEGGTRPVFHPGLTARTSERIRKVVKNITIEPAMFLIAFSSSIDNVANSQMTLLKSCKADFGFNDTVCDNLVTDFPDQNEVVQEEVF
jgi:hypothetical protein